MIRDRLELRNEEYIDAKIETLDIHDVMEEEDIKWSEGDVNNVNLKEFLASIRWIDDFERSNVNIFLVVEKYHGFKGEKVVFRGFTRSGSFSFFSTKRNSF